MPKPEYAYINRILIMPQVLNMPKSWIWQSSGYGRGLNMKTLCSILNILEYALTEFWMYLSF